MHIYDDFGFSNESLRMRIYIYFILLPFIKLVTHVSFCLVTSFNACVNFEADAIRKYDIRGRIVSVLIEEFA